MDNPSNSNNNINSELLQMSLDLGADRIAFVNPGDINFSIDFKEMCAMNSCGKYGTNWMCPPAIGTIEDGIEKIKQFSNGMIIQTVSQLEDSFDFEGMQDASLRHDKVFRDVIDAFKTHFPGLTILPLGVGGCTLCKKCTYTENLPCVQPEKALSSVEAYGIDVNNLLTGAGLKYNNGVATVSYVGLVLF